MPEAKDLVHVALDESRILILGAQILLGFQYRAAFESAFGKFPVVSQQLAILGLGLWLVTITFLMLPVSYHHLVGHGEARIELNTVATAVTAWALLPFAASIGIGLFIVTDREGASSIAVNNDRLIIPSHIWDQSKATQSLGSLSISASGAYARWAAMQDIQARTDQPKAKWRYQAPLVGYVLLANAGAFALALSARKKP